MSQKFVVSNFLKENYVVVLLKEIKIYYTLLHKYYGLQFKKMYA